MAEHYFHPEPGARSQPHVVQLVLPDRVLRLATDRGVFARDRVEPGTKLLLLEGGDPPPGPATLVDLGCGYGPIACTLAGRAPHARVLAVDVNRRARELCAANAEAAGLANVVVLDPAEVPDGLEVDQLWSNPPIRVGKAALDELLAGWLDRLAPGGTAHLVVNRHLGADSLARRLVGAGWEVDRRASRQGYRVLEVRRAA